MEVNKIYLGNAYELIKGVETASVDLIITDPWPPYEIEGIHGSGILKERNNNHTFNQLADSDLDKGIDYAILDDLMRVMKVPNIYIFCNKPMIPKYYKYFVEEHNCNWEILILAKTDPIPFCGTHYLVDKEYCLFFWQTGAYINIPFERAKTVFIKQRNVADKKDFKHPTIKPIDLIEVLIKNSCNSNGGGLILDPFVGSGTTCLGAKHLGHNYIGFEINPEYYQIAVDRLQGINANGEMNLFDI